MSVRLACEPITEAGAILLPTPRYTRGRPVYAVTVNGHTLGEVRFSRRAGWSAIVGGRFLSQWIRYEDGCIGHRHDWDDRHGAVAAILRQAIGVSQQLQLGMETPL